MCKYGTAAFYYVMKAYRHGVPGGYWRGVLGKMMDLISGDMYGYLDESIGNRGSGEGCRSVYV